MQIRSATPADADSVLAIAHATATSGRWSREQYARLFAPAAEDLPREVLVVETETGIGAFLVALAVGSEWELENIVVQPELRGQGLGEQLVSFFLEHAAQQGAERVDLEVREGNEAGRALYEKCGFAETGRRRGYYQDPPEDAILYTYSFVAQK
jgi:ribosomal-protein-alanine N-acetyltransferase